MFRLILSTGLVLALSSVNAHIALWHKGMFGLNWPDQSSNDHQNYNNNFPVVPLRFYEKLTVDQWFGRGLKNYPPLEGDFMDLEAGGTFVGELSCNRAWTTLRNPNMNGQDLHYYACPDVGPLHVNNKYGETPDPQYFGGTSISIAYTSDVASLKPEDMTVISVNYTSVWTRETDYPIPCGLPPCPKGGCLCTWNWIHQAGHGEGYGMEIYNTLYRCNVTGQTNSNNLLPVGAGQIPVLCETDQELCVKGPKQPMYVYQGEGNNLPWPDAPPSYNWRYGFPDGAQLDLFGALDVACPNATQPLSTLVEAPDPVDIGQSITSAESTEPSSVTDGSASVPTQTAITDAQAVFTAPAPPPAASPAMQQAQQGFNHADGDTHQAFLGVPRTTPGHFGSAMNTGGFDGLEGKDELHRHDEL